MMTKIDGEAQLAAAGLGYGARKGQGSEKGHAGSNKELRGY